jgi:hypothetical protein
MSDPIIINGQPIDAYGISPLDTSMPGVTPLSGSFGYSSSTSSQLLPLGLLLGNNKFISGGDPAWTMNDAYNNYLVNTPSDFSYYNAAANRLSAASVRGMSIDQVIAQNRANAGITGRTDAQISADVLANNGTSPSDIAAAVARNNQPQTTTTLGTFAAKTATTASGAKSLLENFFGVGLTNIIIILVAILLLGIAAYSIIVPEGARSEIAVSGVKKAIGI